MKTKNKKKPKLPKYAPGGFTDGELNDEPYNQADPNRVASTQPSVNTFNYGKAASFGTQAISGVARAQNGPGDSTQKNANSVNNVADSAINTYTPWGGLANTGQSLGKSFLKTKTVTNPYTGKTVTTGNDSGNTILNDLFTPTHTQALTDYGNGDTGAAISDIFGNKAIRDVGYSMGIGKNPNQAYDDAEVAQEKYNKEQMNTYSKGGKHRPKLMNPKFISPQPGSQMYGTTPEFGNGGVNDELEPNASIEKQEITIDPQDGSTYQSNSGTHESGNDDNVNMKPGTMILSDRLKMPGTKSTFAKLAKPYTTTKEDKLLSDSDKLSSTKKSSLELMKQVKNAKLNQLFEAQEALKADKVKNYAKKLGLVPDEDSNYANGGIHIKPSHRGRFTAYKERTGKTTEEALHSSNPHVRQMANFARNAKKWHHAMGGTQPPYDENYVQPTAPQGWEGDSPYNPNYTEPAPFYPTPNGEQIPNNYVQTPKGYLAPVTPKPSDPNRTKMDYGQIGDIASGVAQNVGNVWDLYQTNFGKKYDRENYGNVKPELLNNTQALKNERENYLMNKKDFNEIGQGNSGLIMNNLIRNKSKSTADRAGIIENFQNQNAGIANQAKYFNKNLEVKGIEDTEQNKARSEDIARQAIGRIGSNSANAYKDYKTGKMDKQSAQLISNMFTNYKLDMNNPNHWDWVYKQVNKGQ